jgi:NAD(P)-dependent dehydrogenase (short-subunit alcohol dehydrogenase family)/acyl carrier protein
LGLAVAEWLVAEGARHLFLVGRRGVSGPEQAERIRQMAAAGAEVTVIAGDVSQLAAVEQMVAQAGGPAPLRGVIHAAGLLEDGILTQQQWAHFERVMAPKVAGGWNLHQATQGQPLDFFVCFSSSASLLGSAGQGNYAAANAFLDGLIHYRRALGQPGLSLNWGPWAETGMAARLGAAEQARWAAAGIGLIEPAKGLLVLAASLAQKDCPQLGVIPIQWNRFLQQASRSAFRPFLEAFRGAATSKVISRGEFLEELNGAPLGRRRKLLLAHLRRQLAEVLHLESGLQIGSRQRLFDVGMDSLTAVELKNRLEISLACSLPSTLLFDYSTLHSLLDYFTREMPGVFAEGDEEQPAANGAPDADGDALALLSEDEIANLLAEKLSAIRQGGPV